MWPFKSKIPTRISFPVGIYRLGDLLERTTEMVEFSNYEYEVMDRQFGINNKMVASDE